MQLHASFETRIHSRRLHTVALRRPSSSSEQQLPESAQCSGESIPKAEMWARWFRPLKIGHDEMQDWFFCCCHQRSKFSSALWYSLWRRLRRNVRSGTGAQPTLLLRKRAAQTSPQGQIHHLCYVNSSCQQKAQGTTHFHMPFKHALLMWPKSREEYCFWSGLQVQHRPCRHLEGGPHPVRFCRVLPPGHHQCLSGRTPHPLVRLSEVRCDPVGVSKALEEDLTVEIGREDLKLSDGGPLTG
jgi:hypothetical protein